LLAALLQAQTGAARAKPPHTHTHPSGRPPPCPLQRHPPRPHAHGGALVRVIHGARQQRHVPVIVGHGVADGVVEALKQVHVLREADGLLEGGQDARDLRAGGRVRGVRAWVRGRGL